MDRLQPPFNNEAFEHMSKILKAIAHPVKLEVIKILGNQEPLDVSSICELIGAKCEISMMSHHLSKMKDNGILVSEKKGKQVFYRLSDRKILSIFKIYKEVVLMDQYNGEDF